MTKSLPKKKQFKTGDIVQFTHPTNLMAKGFGRRVFPASSETLSIGEQRLIAVNLEIDGVPGALDLALSDPPEEGPGMILCVCFEPKHGTGTWYYKVLLGEQLYWIASEHLSAVEENNV